MKVSTYRRIAQSSDRTSQIGRRDRARPAVILTTTTTVILSVIDGYSEDVAGRMPGRAGASEREGMASRRGERRERRRETVGGYEGRRDFLGSDEHK